MICLNMPSQKSPSLNNNLPLVVDTWGGFVGDRQKSDFLIYAWAENTSCRRTVPTTLRML
jgi:hypothetical protein